MPAGNIKLPSNLSSLLCQKHLASFCSCALYHFPFLFIGKEQKNLCILWAEGERKDSASSILMVAWVSC